MSLGKDPLVSRFPPWYFEAEVLQAFCPPSFRMRTRKGNLLCPVRALDAYVHRAALWHKNEQLFVCFGPPNKGSPASKQKMSKWVVEAISLAYESAGQTFPYGCPVPLNQEYGGLHCPDIRRCSPRGLWCGRLVLTTHIHQILFFRPGLYPRFPSALVLVLLVKFTQDRHSSLWRCYINVPHKRLNFD